MADAGSAVEIPVAGRTIRISSPDRVYFSARGETKLDLVNYYISVGDGIVRALTGAEQIDEVAEAVLEVLCDECESALKFEEFEDTLRKEVLLTIGAR